jgi:hypothetical protein
MLRVAGPPSYHRPIADEPLDPIPEPTAPLPSVAARALAVAVIVIAGVCGGLIGFAVADLQCTGDCGVLVGIGALVGAVVAAGGVAVVAVLALRAMAEWDTVQERQRQQGP